MWIHHRLRNRGRRIVCFNSSEGLGAYGYGLAVLCSECLERLAILVTAPGRQALAHVLGADRYARTHEAIQDEGTGEPE
jgi:hypothetical protein